MADARLLSLISDPAFYADPYRLYAKLRAADPVMFTELRGGSWVFTGYGDVTAGLKSEHLSNARAGAFMTMLPVELRDQFKPLAETLSRWALFYDPPRHTRIRKLMARAFAATSMDTYRTRIERVVGGLLDAVAKRGHMDVIKDFAYELPLLVIIEMLGVPVAKKAEFALWSDDIGHLLGGAAPTVELARKTQRSVVEMTDLLRGEMELRRRHPADDILTTLVHAEEDGDTLTEDEILAQCVLLLFAGHETARNLIGNGLLALLENPDELSRLRGAPSLMKGAVDELLRYDSPVQMLSRLVPRDFEYAGKAIKKGHFVMLFLGAANRDPAQFADPDRLDIGRKEKGHLSFGSGPHVCIGAQIGRLEAHVAFSALLERLPDLQLVGGRPTFTANLVLRGLTSLPITFSTRTLELVGGGSAPGLVPATRAGSPSAPVADNPFAPEHRENPYPLYTALRACAPLAYHEGLGFWIATTAESVQAVLADSDEFSSAQGIGRTRNQVVQRPTMLTRDPPDHTRLRALVSRAFTARRIAELEPRVLEIVTGLLDAGLAKGRFDLAEDFAHPLPTAVLGGLLGVEQERLSDLMRWSEDIFKSVAGIGGHDRQRTKQSYLEFDAYFEKKVGERRRERQADLLGELVAQHEDNDALSTSEILNFCMLLFIAGSETTTNLVTNAVLALEKNPGEARKLRADPSLVPGAIEETLRYDSPVQGIFRTTRRAMDRFGKKLDADEKVCALIASANRDPAVFPDPDRFDVERAPNTHIAFGRGIHYCLGAALARLEAKVAITQILGRTREIYADPTGAPRRLATPMVRGMERYPVVLVPA